MSQKMSNDGIKLLIRWEGLELKIYRDVAGFETIGVGHLLSKSELSSGKIHIGRSNPIDIRKGPITRDMAIKILRHDLRSFRRAVNREVKIDINQHQFDALVMFSFNVGIRAFTKSTLLKRINARRFDDVPAQFMRWTKAGGREVRGLINRRNAEVKLWNKGGSAQLAASVPQSIVAAKQEDEILAIARKLGLI